MPTPNTAREPCHRRRRSWRRATRSASVTDKISAIVLAKRTPRGWFIGFGIAFLLTMLLLVSLTLPGDEGHRHLGQQMPVGWGFDIVNFVWWIGIGHAGTLISAILLLLRQEWRTSINRFAEAMTLFAVACAGLFPLFHIGRPWLVYWLLPYPNTMGVWPQFRSPLVWDVFAVSHLRDGVAAVLVRRPDSRSGDAARSVAVARRTNRLRHARDGLARLGAPLAQLRDGVSAAGRTRRRRWWSRCTPWSASTSRSAILPGWHTTIFPPYFVAGAIYSGFAMVLTLAIPLRAIYGLEDFITMRHLENMAKVMLATGLIVAYGYVTETFIAWYSGNHYERFVPINRLTGPYAMAYWTLILCNIVVPQVLWFKKVRTSVVSLFVISIIVNIGMWLERFVIIVTSLHRDFLPSSWGMYYADVLGLVHVRRHDRPVPALLFLFVRFLPMISIFEMRTLLPEAKVPRQDGRAAERVMASPGSTA